MNRTTARPDNELDEVYSNFDHKLDGEVAELLKAGDSFSRHAAWDFNGSVWFDLASDKWLEEVWVYGSIVETLAGDTVEDVIQQACGKYGLA